MIKRDSNVELLRIAAMFMILLLHADFLALEAPKAKDISIAPLESFAKFYIEALMVIGVNVFVFSIWVVRDKTKDDAIRRVPISNNLFYYHRNCDCFVLRA